MNMEGTIVRLYVKDFVTFYELTIFPNENLNLVTGPNGSGKSSLMCAICLVLGGKPKVVGRASNISSYIRYNAEKATITIELFNPHGRNHVISRTIFQENKSSWSMGGFACTYKEVDALVAKMNIQLDNLCQFMAQDRVQDFARMNSQALMENTEKTIGGIGMWENHMELKRLGSIYLENEKKLQTKIEHLENEEKVFQGLQDDVEKIASKRALIEKIDKLKQKLAYLQYLNVKADVEKSSMVLAEKAKLRKNLEKDKKIIEVTLEKYKKHTNSLENKFKNVDNLYSRHNSSCSEHFELPETIHDKIKENQNKFERWQQNEKKRKDRVKGIQQQIQCLDIYLQKSSEQSLKEKEKSLITEERELSNSRKIHLDQRNELHMKIGINEQQIKSCENQLAKANDVSVVKLQKLKARGLHEAIMWFRENKHKLKAKAYEPMVIVINMKSDGMAKYLENIVPLRDLVAFICEDPTDATFLMQEMRDNRRFKVNILTCKPTIPLSSFTRPYEIESLRKYGFYSFVSDTFTAPETIMRYLFTHYKIHKIPIGDHTTYMKASEIPRNISVFMTENKKFSIRISNYSSEAISSSTDLKPSFLLTASVNEASIKEVTTRMAKLKEESQNLHKECAKMVTQDKEFSENLKTIRDKRSEVKEEINKIQVTRIRVAALEKNALDISQMQSSEEEERQKLAKLNQEGTMKLISVLGQNVAHLKKFGEVMMMMKITDKEIHKARYNASFHEHKLIASDKKVKAAQKVEIQFKEILNEAENLADRYMKQLEDLTKMKYNSPSFQKLLKEFDQLPETSDEIKNEIHMTQTKADCLGHSDENIILEYERRKASVAALKKIVEQVTLDLSDKKGDIEKIKSSWDPFINNLIKKLNTTFGDLLAKINYVGEVVLVKGESEDDYSNYGFKIQVKFRQEGELQELNHYRQSGGERAVAIAIYLMSLQEMTPVPFRCVDEINQGMDELHETVVFKLLSDIISEKKSAQYFLFTPKVLTTLRFSNTMNFICVHNGELESNIVDPKAVIKKKKQQVGS